jgi:hypothetical protein
MPEGPTQATVKVNVLQIRRSPMHNAPERVFITDLHATTKVNVLQIWAAYAQLNA